MAGSTQQHTKGTLPITDRNKYSVTEPNPGSTLLPEAFCRDSTVALVYALTRLS